MDCEKIGISQSGTSYRLNSGGSNCEGAMSQELFRRSTSETDMEVTGFGLVC
jgi:hypothetical protein